jgi:hypothetical protein
VTRDEDIRATSLTLAARARCDARTVEKMLRGGAVRPVVRFAIETAARELNIPLPTPTATSAQKGGAS